MTTEAQEQLEEEIVDILLNYDNGDEHSMARAVVAWIDGHPLLRSGWVSMDELVLDTDNATSDVVVADKEGNKTTTYILYALLHKDEYVYFVPLPPLPEVE